MELGVIFWPWPWMLTALVILATACIGLLQGLFTLPIIGDAILVTRGIRDFMIDRFARYGDPFTITLMGTKHTVVNSPETIKFVLLSGHTSFESGYAKQVVQLLGEGTFATSMLYRKHVLAKITGEGLQRHLAFINSLAEETVKSWENRAEVNAAEEARKFTLKVGMHVTWEDVPLDSEEMEEIGNDFGYISRAVVGLPINLPGFVLHKGLKARERLILRIQRTIAKRRQAGSQVNDVLNAFMSMPDSEVTDYDRSSQIVALVFASFITSTTMLTWVLKYLHDFPEVRQRVQNEQDGIRLKVVEDKLMTSFKLKSSMPYTLQVINEILRIEATIAIIPRQTIKDVDHNGLVLPKGTLVWASLASLHHNPTIYPNPQEFDPSRFEEKPRANTFIPFGQGTHACPGSDLVLMEMLFMVHHLVTKHNWERCGPEQGVISFPMRKPIGGFPFRLVKRGPA